MRLYKLLPAVWAFENIKKKRVKISVLGTLNDPWDYRCVKFCETWQKSAWEEMISRMSQLHGIICFSKNWTNPVVWSHYAKNHEGIALGFDVRKTDATGKPLFLEVKYSKKLIDFCGGNEPDEKFMRKVIAAKFKSWHYEEEVRHFASLTDSDPENNHFFMNFKPNYTLREIIFGVNYHNPEEMAAILSVARKYPNVDCWRATLGSTDFNLIKDPNWKFER